MPFSLQSSPVYDLMYIYYAYASITITVGIPCCDALIMDLYLHIGVLFKAVSFDLETLVQGIVCE